MDFWSEFLATSWAKEFLAGGFGGSAGVIAGYPLDTLRIRQQFAAGGSAFAVCRQVLATEGLVSLYRGMAAPLASVTFQNAIAFQTYALLSRVIDDAAAPEDPPSYRGVVMGGIGTGAIQSLVLSPIELVKIRLQLQISTPSSADRLEGPFAIARSIFRSEGLKGMYRGLAVTVLRDAPAHGVYFWSYEYTREFLHPGCRKNGQESFRTMLLAGGLAGVSSWICCYPLDVIKTRIQANSHKYSGIIDCFRRSVKEEGHNVLWRGMGTAVARAFVVNGAIFTAYETALRCLFNNNGDHVNAKD